MTDRTAPSGLPNTAPAGSAGPAGRAPPTRPVQDDPEVDPADAGLDAA